MSFNAVPPPLVKVDLEMRTTLQTQLAGQLQPGGLPEFVLLRGPSHGPPVSGDVLDAEVMALLGPKKQGIAKQIRMRDGGCITVRPGHSGLVSSKIFISEYKNRPNILHTVTQAM